MTDPFVNGPRAARPALLPPVWPPLDPETGQFDLSDEADPPDGFFMDPDIARRFDEATTIAEGLSPADAMRDSNDKLSELTRAQWDFDVRRRAFEEAQAFSFTDPVDGAEPVFAEFSSEAAEKVDRFTGETGLQVDFPPEHGGYFAAVRDPVEDREIGVVPRGLVLALADNAPGSGVIEAEAGIPDQTRDPDEEEGWLSQFLRSERLREIILDSLPGIGHARAGVDAYESYRDAIEAVRREDWDAFVHHGGMGLLNTLGVLGGPLGAPLVRIAKIGIRQLAGATPGVRRIVAARGVRQAAKAADRRLPGTDVDKTLRRTFKDLTGEQTKLVKAIFPNVIGAAGERHAIRQLRDMGLNVGGQGRATTATVNIGSKTVKRRYDAVITKNQGEIFAAGATVFDPKALKIAVEVKTQSARRGKQAPIDEAVAKDGRFAQQVLPLHYSVNQIPQKHYEQVVRQMFAKHISSEPGGLSQKQVDRIVKDLDRLHRSGWDWVTADLIVGIATRQAANVMAWNEEERRRKMEREARLGDVGNRHRGVGRRHLEDGASPPGA